MVTLTFLVCFANGQCLQDAPSNVLTSVAQCERQAEQLRDMVEEAVIAGNLPPHMAYHKCIEWGTAS